MPEKKLTTRRQIEQKKAEAELKLAEIERELEKAKFHLNQSNEELALAWDQRKSIVATTVDVYKLSFEAMKHLTTLSVGSIVLMVTFLERLFNINREWTGLVGLSLICFIVSIILASYSMTQWPTTLTLMVTAKKVEEAKPRALRQVKREQIAFLTFLLGMVSLVVFAFKNLY